MRLPLALPLLAASVVASSPFDAEAQKRNTYMTLDRNLLTFDEAPLLPTVSALPFRCYACISDTTGQLKAMVMNGPQPLPWYVVNGDLEPYAGLPAGFNCSLAQSPKVQFVPKPASPDSAYLVFVNQFTVAAPHMYRLGVLAMRVGAPGEATGEIHPSIHWLADSVAAGFLILPHANGEDYWLLLQPVGGNSYHAYRITANGIVPVPVVSNAGPVRSIDWQFGLWVPNTAGDVLAITRRRTGQLPANADTLDLDLYGFDLAQGTVSHTGTLPSQWVEGMEFSPSGQYLYVIEKEVFFLSSSGCEMTLVQYDLAAADVAASRTVVHQYANPSFSTLLRVNYMLLGNDGRIYRAYQEDDATHLGVIMHPDLPAPDCDYQPEGLAYPEPVLWGFAPPMKRYHDSPAIITAVAERAPPEMRVAPQPLLEGGWLSHPSLEGSIQIRWHDAAGRIAREDPVLASAGRARIEADGLAPGLYTVEVSGGQLAAPVSGRIVVGH